MLKKTFPYFITGVVYAFVCNIPFAIIFSRSLQKIVKPFLLNYRLSIVVGLIVMFIVLTVRFIKISKNHKLTEIIAYCFLTSLISFIAFLLFGHVFWLMMRPFRISMGAGWIVLFLEVSYIVIFWLSVVFTVIYIAICRAVKKLLAKTKNLCPTPPH